MEENQNALEELQEEQYEQKQDSLQNAKNFILILLIGILCFYTLINNVKNSGQVLPMIFGKGCAVVMTGSMEPTIPVDSLIFVSEEDNYFVGDIVVIQDYYNLIVHRIVEIDVAADRVVTKGDANNTEDDPVPMSLVRGKVVGHLSRVGRVVQIMKTPLGGLIIISIVVLLWLSLNKNLNEDENEDNNENENDDEQKENEMVE